MRMVTIIGTTQPYNEKRHEKKYIGKEEAKVFENNVNVYLGELAVLSCKQLDLNT